MTREYTRRPDLYDLEHAGDTLPGELDFYQKLAVNCGGPVLELGFGTGRVGLHIARAGVEVYGLDLSRPMLAHAQTKLDLEPGLKVTLVEGSMADFDIGRQFNLIYVPFRAFLHLTNHEDQRRALRCVRRHLAPGGRFAGNFFRPRLDMLQTIPEERIERVERLEGGRTLVRSCSAPRCNVVEQWKEYIFHTRIYAADGALEEERIDFLELAWYFGRDWKLMLELEGFELERLEGGFQGQTVEQGTEYVWVARSTSTDEVAAS